MGTPRIFETLNQASHLPSFPVHNPRIQVTIQIRSGKQCLINPKVMQESIIKQHIRIYTQEGKIIEGKTA